MDPLEFLREHEPFSRLPPGRLEWVGRELEIAYAPRGTRVLTRGGDPNTHLWVVRKGSVKLEVDGRAIDVLVDGEVFGFTSLLSGGRPQFDVTAGEDCLLYKIPSKVFHSLREDASFGEFFQESLARRLRGATRRESVALAGDLATPVGKLVRRPPVVVSRETSVGAAARRMRDERVSSVLVSGEPMGIVTDADLRSRVLAEGLGPDVPVTRVMSAPLKTFPAESPLVEALLYVLGERIHHLALERRGEVVGVVTHSDILRHQSKSPGYLLKTIEKSRGPEDWAGYAGEITGMVESLVWAGLEATRVGHVVASLNDALVQQILRTVEAELGPPPCPYAWIVFGSEGRREQALITDQDNALVFAEDAAGAREYFERLAARVIESLTRASFPPCAGGFMATRWNKTLAEWDELFRSWIESPEPESLIEVQNFFDFRAIHGALDLSPLHRRILEGSRSAIFLAHLARASLGMQPPIGLFRRIKEDEDGVDLKAGGIMPTVSLARVAALEAGSGARSTIARLEAGREGGTLSEDGADTLAEGFRFLFRLRLQTQLAAMRRGEPASNRVRGDDLSPLDRRHLKETFLHVREMQEALAQRFKTGMLG